MSYQPLRLRSPQKETKGKEGHRHNSNVADRYFTKFTHKNVTQLALTLYYFSQKEQRQISVNQMTDGKMRRAE